jgi:hypothetical protein
MGHLVDISFRLSLPSQSPLYRRLRAIHDVCQSWYSPPLTGENGRLGAYTNLNKLRSPRNWVAGLGPGYSMYNTCYYRGHAPMVHTMSSGTLPWR